jgi:hypothetical protein
VPASFLLMDAVQDLYDLYQRASPCGPYRLPLFSDIERGDERVPQALRDAAQRIDTLVRGAGCLLANHLAPAALPLISALWRSVQEFEVRWLPSSSQPAYYGFLTRELAVTEDDAALQAYRLFGEVLAVYLDVLAAKGLPGTVGLAQAVLALRRALAQIGERSSPGSSGGGGAPPAP